ncbi:lysophosphatidic acid receptor 5-like protein [Camelus ferus]|nr:lysophosphatidic acid receptor 5-like protein [Camelus ferus]
MLANSLANTSINDSVNKCPDHQPIHHLHLVVYSVVLAAGLPLNALALWVFLRALRVHSVVSVYMCNLAASDLLFTLSLPLRLSYYARHYWPFSELLCQLAGAVFQMNMYGSCIFLTLINVDRYAAIVHPLRLRHLRRPRVAGRRGPQPGAPGGVRRVLMVLVLLAGANCVLDPLVYYFSAEGFRNTLRGLSTPLRDRTLAANGARGALAEPSTETSHATTTAAGSQGLLGPSNPRSSFLQCQDPEDSSL